VAAIRDRDRAAALADLELLYTDLPDLACKGLCGHSCTHHVDAPTTEQDRLLTDHGLDLDAPTTDGACPAPTRTLGPTGSCAVHPHRPAPAPLAARRRADANDPPITAQPHTPHTAPTASTPAPIAGTGQ